MSGQERVLSGTAAELAPQNGRRLKTWKEIAAFLGCDTRTARRWESTRALPVRRYPNGSRSAVYVYESELRAWLDHDSTPEESGRNASPLPQRRRDFRLPFLDGRGWAAMATGALLLLAAATWELWPAKVVQAAHRPPPAAEALYREGLYSWQTRTPIGLSRAIADFRRATKLDPNYAAAFAELAICYDLISEYTTAPAAKVFPQARASAGRALALDPSLADAHAALAFADFFWFHDARTAEREFRKATALAPASALARHWHATFLLSAGEPRRALSEIEAAQRLDSESSAILADKGLILFAAGEPRAGIALLRQLERTQPLFASPHKYLAMIYKGRGEDRAYLEELAKSGALRGDPADSALAAAGARGLAAGGHLGMLKSLLVEQERLTVTGKRPSYDLARAYAELGNRREALRSLEASVARREMNLSYLASDPVFAALRKEPRYRALTQHADFRPN